VIDYHYPIYRLSAKDFELMDLCYNAKLEYHASASKPRQTASAEAGKRQPRSRAQMAVEIPEGAGAEA
jgi:hypothetical protein